MPQHIEVPGMGIVEFPDGMTDEQIVSAIKNNTPKQNAPRETALNKVAGGIVGAGNAAVNFAKGASESLVNLPAQALNLALPQKAQLPTFHDTGQGMAYGAGKVGGDIASYMGGGEALDMARGAAEAIPYAGKIARSLGKQSFTSNIARQALGGAVYGAATNPEDKGVGAAIGGSIGGLGGILGEGINALRPSRLFGNKSKTAEELRANLNAAGDTKTGIGDVIGSPALKTFYENEIAKTPLSGSDDAMQSTAKHITEQGNKILSGYLKDTRPEDVAEKIGEALKGTYSDAQAEKNSLYGEVNSLARQKGLKLDLSEFENIAKKHSNIIKDQNFLKFEPEAKSLLSKMANFEDTSPALNQAKGNVSSMNTEADARTLYSQMTGKRGVNTGALGESYGPAAEGLGQDASAFKNKNYGTADKRSISDVIAGNYPKKNTSLEEANIMAGLLNSQAKKYLQSPLAEDRNAGNVLSQLGIGLKNSIKKSIKNSGDQELENSFQKAEKNYQKKFSPFLDKDVYKFLGGDKTPDEILSSFIKTGNTTDKGSQLNKLMSKLPPDAKDLVKYSYFSRAIRGGEDERGVDPKALNTLWNDTKLGQNQKKALMPDPAERKQMDNYVKLVGMNTEPLSIMANPKTGARYPKAIKELLTTGGGAYIGSKFDRGNPVAGAIAGGAAGAGVNIAGARLLSHLLTSPGMRRKVVNEMINPTNLKGGSMTKAIAQAIANKMQGDQ